jgi:ferredoxin
VRGFLFRAFLVPPPGAPGVQDLHSIAQNLRGGFGGDLLRWGMASLTERLPANATGRYYVDSSCIDCDQCRAMAPEFFTRDADNGISLVGRQPTTPEEIAAVEEAMSACAVGSIGNDGE